MNKILVTGGAGFIGSNLCQYLLADKKNSVICLDNLSTGSKSNIEHLLSNKNFQFIESNVCEKINIKVNQIYNLACPASPIQYQRLPLETMNACIDGSRNLLELAKANNATILQSSTSEVYGDPMEHPQNESYFGNVNINGPRSCYDEGKRMAETIFCNYRDIYNVDIRIARIFNTYGPNMEKNDGRVISNFIVQALSGKDITIYGDGNQTRSFCYIDDMIIGLTSLMNSDFSNPVNIGNDTEFTILDAAKTIIDLTASSSNIIFKTFPENDPFRRKPDLSLATEKLNFEPSISFSVGLEKTILYFEKL
jgi:UDP-glucuronate decarboxylase